jgi:transcriptional regulator with XRE-family HTH domain
MADIADKKALGTRIKALRKVRHWTQKELGQRLGIRFEQLNKYESGLNSPPVEMLVKLADALETSVDYLLTGTGTDSTLANARLFRRFQALEHLGEEDQLTVIRVIDAMLAQQRVASAMVPVD